MSLLNSLNNKITKTVEIQPKQNDLLKLKDAPVVFLSYDEPNADENFQFLLDNHPNAE